MGKTEIILLILAITILAIRMYKKFTKKDGGNQKSNLKSSQDPLLKSSSKDDDYEPYAKK